jgi:hypothetical protein
MSMCRSLCSLSFLALILCVSPSRAAEPAGATAAIPATPATIEITARLVNLPGKFPADDLYDYVYVMQYQVEGGELDKQTILVGHYKPLRARVDIDDKMKKYVGGSLRRFEPGALHRLVLTAEMKKVWKGAVVDEFFDSDRKSRRYFCLKADLAPGK